MKPSTLTLSLALTALLGALAAGAPCDFGAIQGALFPNATDGLKQCTAATGVDIWGLTEFPTAAQVEAMQQNRGCVDFVNQVSQRANTLIQCETTVGTTTVSFGDLLNDFLTGHTGNETESASGSSSEDIAFPSDSGSSEASASGSSEESGSEERGSGSDVGTDAGSTAGSKTSGAAGAAAFSMALAGAALACSLVL